jgi:hypothetical protein
VYGIIGESDSDANTLKELVRRLAENRSLRIQVKGYEGCTEMLRKGAVQLKLFARLGMTRFIIAHDSESSDAAISSETREKVMAKIVRPSGIKQNYCVLIPVQEIEAWILADIEAVSHVFTSWNPMPIDRSPELIDDPKEYLKRLSRDARKKPRYDNATHNELIAKHLRLDIVRTRCPSFAPLADFVTGIS